ncbi:hypothetical protein LCGC14_1342770 [marine sediment metagenome]|uniref:Uncharacterized protein n=1 Tax=marine sediment metagenome TaxID=412755 RepID=A0A0F9MU19_9ZZZZ
MAKSRAKKKGTRVIPTKTETISFKVTPDQYAMVVKRAEGRGLLLGQWTRGVALRAAEAPINGNYIRIYEPDGATS